LFFKHNLFFSNKEDPVISHDCFLLRFYKSFFLCKIPDGSPPNVKSNTTLTTNVRQKRMSSWFLFVEEIIWKTKSSEDFEAPPTAFLTSLTITGHWVNLWKTCKSIIYVNFPLLLLLSDVSKDTTMFYHDDRLNFCFHVK